MTSFRRSDAAFLGFVAIGVGVGVVLNPWLDSIDAIKETALGVVAATAIAAIALEVVRSLRRTPDEHSISTSPNPLAWPVGIGLTLVLVAFLAHHRGRWLKPTLFADDYQYIAQSVDWDATVRHLFVPYNEHLAPLTRLVTFGLLQAGGDRPWGFMLFNLVLFAATTFLVFLVGRRIGRGDLAGLAAAAIFAVSDSHDEIVYWYSASLWLFSVCLLLGSMLLVERDGRVRLAMATLFAAFGPWCYSVGALVGPLTSLWLIGWHRRRRWDSLLPAVAGVASTFVVLAIIRESMKSDAYWSSGGRGFSEAFSPWMGFVYSARMFVDRSLLIHLGRRNGPLRIEYLAVVFGFTCAAIVAAVRWRPRLAGLWPIAGIIVLGYAIALPFRTWVPYEWLFLWSRYQLFPQLGLALVVAGVLGLVPRLQGPLGWRSFAAFVPLLVAWLALQWRPIAEFRW